MTFNPRICIAGKNQIAVDAFLYLIRQGYQDKLLVCPNRTDSGKSTWQPSLKRFANEYSTPIISLYEASQIDDLVFISLEFDQLINPSLFISNRLYNFHFSALPLYKGMYTSCLPILHDCTATGVTLHEIDSGIDTGPIIAQELFTLDSSWTARDLYFAYMKNAFVLFCANYKRLLSSSPPDSSTQPASVSTYFSRKSIDYKDVQINLVATAHSIVQQLKAFSFREYQVPNIHGLSVGSWEILPSRSSSPPGTIVETVKDGFKLSTIDFDLLISRFSDWDWFNFKSLGPINRLNPSTIDLRDAMGWTPLIRAAFAGDFQLCQQLLSSGADPNLPNTNGTTPLMYVFSGSTTDSVQLSSLLIKFGADITQKDGFGHDLYYYHPDCFS